MVKEISHKEFNREYQRKRRKTNKVVEIKKKNFDKVKRVSKDTGITIIRLVNEAVKEYMENYYGK